MTDDEARPYGRRAFLGLLAGGLSSLLWAEPAARALSPVTSGFSQLLGNLLPVGGWRIYTISGSMPIFDERTWRLTIDGLVRKPQSLTYEQLRPLVDVLSLAKGLQTRYEQGHTAERRRGGQKKNSRSANEEARFGCKVRNVRSKGGGRDR